MVASYWKFCLNNENGKRTGPFGYMPEWVVSMMPWHEQWNIDPTSRSITPPPFTSQNQSIKLLLESAKEKRIFDLLEGWRSEAYAIRGSETSEGDIIMERAGSPLFGINTYGVHMTVYVNTAQDGMKIWVPRRAKDKQTYGGYLDNSVAGGLGVGEKPFDCLIREAAEEASFSEQLVCSNAIPVGTVSYFHIRDTKAGGEAGLLQPESQYVYDMEIGPEVIPRPGDNEVEAFYLWSIDKVKDALAQGQFKPNCALVILDFFIRHGHLTAENDKHYVEIVTRLHRRLPFPTN